MSQVFFISDRIISVWNPLLFPLKVKSVSWSRQESAHKMNDTYKVSQFYRNIIAFEC